MLALVSSQLINPVTSNWLHVRGHTVLVSLSDNVVKVESSDKYFQRTTEVYLKDEHVFT